MIAFKSRMAMGAGLLCLLLSGAFPAPLSAQESILSSYERNFIRAGLAAKTGILNDAAMDERSGEFMGAFYEFALQFALNNGDYLRDDNDMIALVATAARGAGRLGNKDSVRSLWGLFRMFGDSYSRVEILNALAILGRGNYQVIANLNQLLDDMNNSYRAGIQQDYPVLRACIAALGALRDSSSFPVLFSAMTLGYAQTVTQETLKALESIEGNYKDYLISIIRRNPFNEKAAAFRLGAYNEKLKVSERAEIAMAALDVSLSAPFNSSSQTEANLRYDAITVITRLKWSPASSSAIRNFYRVQTDYARGEVQKERLLEAIACLGVMGNAEASQALALQLGYLNSRTESTGEYDEAVIMALIGALGELGDKSAFDYLLYVSFLNYPDKIQASAREALNRLRW